jgi:hypothetical protein
MLSYPSDEVGNELVSLDKIDEAGINPYSDVLSLEKYRGLFGENRHELQELTTSPITASSSDPAVRR